ncbi:MAG: hypothetical protein Q4F03_03295 [Eubacteriales bacterium]|nr:hypothetical protein [Eubacteriales bacterium]
MILEPGNLLNMARLDFRVKYNDQFRGNPQPRDVVCFIVRQAFFYGIIACS